MSNEFLLRENQFSKLQVYFACKILPKSEDQEDLKAQERCGSEFLELVARRAINLEVEINFNFRTCEDKAKIYGVIVEFDNRYSNYMEIYKSILRFNIVISEFILAPISDGVLIYRTVYFPIFDPHRDTSSQIDELLLRLSLFSSKSHLGTSEESFRVLFESRLYHLEKLVRDRRMNENINKLIRFVEDIDLNSTN
jgi:hypothetical protein